MRTASFSRSLPGVSRRTIAALLVASPVAASVGLPSGTAFAQQVGFQASLATGVSVVHGSATITTSGSVETVSIPTSSPVTTINWTPSDNATNPNVPINFLPVGNTVSYVGAAGATVPYTVLNRILPSDQTRPIAFYGTVESTPNTSLWFYSPSGLLIGSTANFYVGGLVLTAADPVTDGNGNFIATSGGTQSFSVAATAGSQAAITIQPNANIEAINSGQSNYIVAIAPQINQGGKISVVGSAALVAAESATFAIDSNGLFNISVTSGTTVTDNAFVHTGSTGGPDAAAAGTYQRVYMVAVPKNDAITMAIASGGSIGFATADAANLDGDEIVLSAGSNIADTGTGSPVVPGNAGSGTTSLTVGGGLYTSNTYAVSTNSVTVTDPVTNFNFMSDLSVIAPQATVNVQTGTFQVGGDLIIDADSTANYGVGSALVEVSPGASLAVGTNADQLGVNGDLTVTADDAVAGIGGSASIQSNYGAISVNNNVLVSASGSWGTGAQNSEENYYSTQGGTAQVSINGGSLSIGGSLTVNAVADATYADDYCEGCFYDYADTAVGGSASVTASNYGSLSANNGISVSADAISGGGYGNATGGTALIEASSGATLGVGDPGSIGASADATPGYSEEENSGSGGASTGGNAQIIANGGIITVAGVNGIFASADAIGADASPYSDEGGYGGDATGGIARIATQASNGFNASIASNTDGLTYSSESSTYVEATAQGGDAYGYGSGGTAVGGNATLQVTGANQSITIDQGVVVSVNAYATGGAGAGQGGGGATGGTAALLANGGSIAITNTNLSMNAAATGGFDSQGNGGNAAGGTVQFAASASGTINADVPTYFAASAMGGNGSGNGGNALGGNIFITLADNGSNFDNGDVADELDASSTAGLGNYGGGTGGANGTTASAGGALITDLGALNLAGSLAIDGNTQLYVQAGGAINVSGTITGTGAGAYLHLWADDLGTGNGTVTLAGGALDLPGNQIDIYYNPASIGSPTDFSAGVAAGNWTGYQLIDNVTELQEVGSYLTQNFALGTNIDASATEGWNDGAGFVPIGNPAAPFTGNFDGLNHTINNLYVNDNNTQGSQGIGLFGEVSGAGVSAMMIRNVGVINADVSGGAEVGILIGGINDGGCSNCGSITISNSFSTGTVTAMASAGGLIGAGSAQQPVLITGSHSDANVTVSGGNVGGLLGGLNTTIIDSFATGSVTAGNGAQYVGGLVGELGGSITNAYATGAVTSGTNSQDVGGLVGTNNAALTRVYAVGAVTVGAGSASVGGLVGENGAGNISESYASGPVSASDSTNVGGLVGLNDAGAGISNSYWDTYSTGQPSGIGGGDMTDVSNLNSVTSDPTQVNADNYAFNPNSYSNFPYTDWIYDNYNTRPVGAWEAPVAQFGVATIDSAHQLQLIDLNMAGSYLITQNIDMRGTEGTTDIWGPGGFMPLGGAQEDPPFTGTLEGGGHVLQNLTMAPGFGFYYVGLIQDNLGRIADLGLSNVNITASQAYDVGALAGGNSGLITDSFATGTITATQYTASNGTVGGLVGYNSGLQFNQGSGLTPAGSITQSYASVAVSGGSIVGGLVGENEGAISETYANGAVSGTLAGGLVGATYFESGPTVTNSYWDTQRSGQSAGCGLDYSGACSGATALTTAQTLQASSYTGFAIDTIGGQGLPWRQYDGESTPLLEAFLTPISVQPGSLTTQYDAQVPDLGVTLYGAQPAYTFGTPAVAGLSQNAGTYAITYAGGLYSNQLGYDFVPSSTPGTLVITPAPLTLSAVPDSKVYDATTNSSGVPQVSGLYGEDSVSYATQSFTSPNVMGTNGSTLVVNPGYVVSDGNGGNNYTVTLQSAAGTITPAALTLAAVSDTKVYDSTTNSSGQPQAVGLQGEDSVSYATQSFTSPNVMGTNASTLVVTPGYSISDGNGGNNYTVTLQSAAGTITPAALAITYLANPATSTYGNAISALSGSVAAQGLQGEDTLGSVTLGTASFTTSATGQSNVGTYAITGSGLSGSDANYTFSFAQASGNATALTIVPRPITVTADPQQRNAGALNPALTYAVTGSSEGINPALVNGDQLTGQLATTATTSSLSGMYPILQGTLAATPNYQLTYVGNVLTVVVPPSIPFTNTIESNLPDQTGNRPFSQQKKRQEDAELAWLYAGLGLHPPEIAQSLINEKLVTAPLPVNEPVTSNGNASLWSPGAP